MPYAPQQLNIGAGALAGGIASAGNSIASAILDHKRTKEETQAADATAEALAGIFQQNNVPLPTGWEKFPGMSSSAKKGFLGTAVMGLTTALQERERQQNNKLQDLYGTIAQGRDQRERAGEEALVAALQQAQRGGAVGPTGPQVPQLTMQDIVTAIGQNPVAMRDPDARRILIGAMQQNATEPPFEPSGTMVDVGGIKIPVVKTSRNSAQAMEGFATDAQGRPSGKYKTPEGLTPQQQLQSVDRRLAAYKAYVGPMRNVLTPEDKQEIEALEAEREAILNGGATADRNVRPPAKAANADVTEVEYSKLKKGDTYWFGGKQYTKK